MRERWKLRGEAILDGITGIVRAPTVISAYGEYRHDYRYPKSDVEEAWASVGQYMRIAMRELDTESSNGPRHRK